MLKVHECWGKLINMQWSKCPVTTSLKEGSTAPPYPPFRKTLAHMAKKYVRSWEMGVLPRQYAFSPGTYVRHTYRFLHEPWGSTQYIMRPFIILHKGVAWKWYIKLPGVRSKSSVLFVAILLTGRYVYSTVAVGMYRLYLGSQQCIHVRWLLITHKGIAWTHYQQPPSIFPSVRGWWTSAQCMQWLVRVHV